MSRVALASVVAAVGALAAASLTPAKEGARARLSAKLPLSAAPGSTVNVAWAVDVADGQGIRRPFNATGMFVQLLSRTSAPATVAFASPTAHADGRYVASAPVPIGGIGGIRTGLRGTTDVFFPLVNDPFTSPGGVRCDVAAVRMTLAAFVSAYNAGDLKQLDALFSRRRFAWYSSGEPGRRLGGDAAKRKTLMAYFRRRHAQGDSLGTLAHRFNGYDSKRKLGNFELSGERRAEGFRDGRWFRFRGKGALDCAKPSVSIVMISIA